MEKHIAHSADRRRRSGAQTSATEVERSRTGRRSVRAQWRTPPEGGGSGLVLPRTFVFRVIPSNPTVYRLSQLHIQFSHLCSC